MLADFCKDCYKDVFDNMIDEKTKIVESKKHWDLCEGCGKVKPVVVKVRRKWFWER